MRTAVLLGAGFSHRAGYPLAADINDRLASFDPDGAIVSLSSSEYGWTDRLGPRNVPQGYNDALGFWLKRLVQEYLAKHVRFNYEEFYEFIRVHYRDAPVKQKAEWYEETVNVVKARYPGYWEETIRMGMPLSSLDLLDRLNGLISDLLRPKQPQEVILRTYQPLLDKLDTASTSLCFVTLNHDLLLEGLLKGTNKSWSDGFTTSDGRLIDLYDQPLLFYNDVFDERIEILKLHGSIDMYRFHEAEPVGPNTSQMTGVVYYIKPGSHQSKLHARLRHQPPGISSIYSTNPEFITGVNKPELMDQSPMYKPLFQRAAKQLAEASRLIIIGYGFGDSHINALIQEAIQSDPQKKVAVVKRSGGLPEELNPSHIAVSTFTDMDSIIHFLNEG